MFGRNAAGIEHQQREQKAAENQCCAPEFMKGEPPEWIHRGARILPEQSFAFNCPLCLLGALNAMAERPRQD